MTVSEEKFMPIMHGKCPCGKGYVEKYKYYYEEWSSWSSSKDGYYVNYSINCPNCSRLYKIGSSQIEVALSQCQIGLFSCSPFSINIREHIRAAVRYTPIKHETVICYKSLSYEEFTGNYEDYTQLQALWERISKQHWEYFENNPWIEKIQRSNIEIPEWVNIHDGIYWYRWLIDKYSDIDDRKLIIQTLLDSTNKVTSIKPLIKYDVFSVLSKEFNTRSIKKIRQLLQFYLNLIDVMFYSQEFQELCNQYKELGNKYYAQFEQYRENILQSILQVELFEIQPNET